MRLFRHEPITSSFVAAAVTFTAIAMTTFGFPYIFSSLSLGHGMAVTIAMLGALAVGFLAFAAWIVFVVLAFRQKRGRGLWTLLGLPFAAAAPLFALLSLALYDTYGF